MKPTALKSAEAPVESNEGAAAPVTEALVEATPSPAPVVVSAPTAAPVEKDNTAEDAGFIKMTADENGHILLKPGQQVMVLPLPLPKNFKLSFPTSAVVGDFMRHTAVVHWTEKLKA